LLVHGVHISRCFAHSPLRGLNPRPYAYEAHALPAELKRLVIILQAAYHAGIVWVYGCCFVMAEGPQLYIRIECAAFLCGICSPTPRVSCPPHACGRGNGKARKGRAVQRSRIEAEYGVVAPVAHPTSKGVGRAWAFAVRITAKTLCPSG
jgi:hypothetical protein